LQQEGLLKHLVRFPEQPVGQYLLEAQLRATSEYAAQLDVDWAMRTDGDEVRCSPWPGITLREAIWRVQDLGYNAIDFTVIDFRFINDKENCAPYQETLTFWEFGRRPGHFAQVKLWQNRQKVELSRTGGHLVEFEGRRIFPLKFLLKHYPLRSKSHAEAKVFRDRIPRFIEEKNRLGWHIQYDHFTDPDSMRPWSRSTLIPWHPAFFMNEYLTERLFGIGIREND
jgi:hypothetical protein